MERSLGLKRPQLVLLAVASFGACQSANVADGPLVVQRGSVGDTVFVHTSSGSEWGRPARLREDLVIGVFDGAEEETFGLITELAVDPSGGILVFDAQVPALRHFDRDGEYIGTYGREGAGPGEYRDAVRGLAVRSDGYVLLRDMRNARINIYMPEGEYFDQLSVASGLFSSQAMTLDTAGNIFLKVLLVRPEPGLPLPRPWPVGLLHLDAAGQFVDTIRPPDVRERGSGGSGPLHPAPVWAVHPYGHMVAGLNDEYSFDVRLGEGGVIRVSRAHVPVPVSDGEFAKYEEGRKRQIEEDRDMGYPDPPQTARVKPAYKAFYFGTDGRIWVHRSMPAEPSEDVLGSLGPMVAPAPNWPFYEPLVFDVFEIDGTYLGEVPLPRNVRPHVFTSDAVYAVRAGKYDEQYVVRYRLEIG